MPTAFCIGIIFIYQYTMPTALIVERKTSAGGTILDRKNTND